MRTHDSTLFIPGGTSGIGLALAVALHERGSTVVVGGRRRDALERIRAEHPGIDTVEIDTTDPMSIDTAVTEVLERHPDLDGLVTMAGIMGVEDWAGDPSAALASAERIVETNVLGPLRLVARLSEHLQSRPGATIMTVSSGLAFAPLAPTPTYNASKAAIHQFSETLRLQLADTSVAVVELVPPAVQTSILPGQETSDWAMPLQDFVDEVVDLLESQPDAHEIQVERVKFLRYGEVRGDYDEVVRTLNALDVHAH